MMPPEATFQPGGARGEHFYSNGDWAGWVSFGNLDYMASVFSHELVEMITDPQPNNGAAWLMTRTIDGGQELGDACNNTVDRVNGLLVQAYWSEAHKACVIPRLNVARELALSAVQYNDYNRDGLTDISFHRPGSTWVTVPELFRASLFPTMWFSTNQLADFANQPGVIAIPGQFNRDGRTDVAFYKPGSNWDSVPVLFNNGNGTWAATNFVAPFANQPNVVAVPGDYNGDGLTDIAFYRADGVWNTVPVLFSNGDGSWNATNFPVPGWANQAGVIAVPGDYNGDHNTDIAFYKPGGGWNTVPVLFGTGNGSWWAANLAAPDWANQPGVIAVPGDFDHDGNADLAFYRPGGPWNTIPVLFGSASGWKSSNLPAPDWANAPGVIAVPGDFDGDGFSDIAFYNPGTTWTTMPVLFGHGQNVPWTFSDFAVPDWSREPTSNV
jgi:hypothetical protein